LEVLFIKVLKNIEVYDFASKISETFVELSPFSGRLFKICPKWPFYFGTNIILEKVRKFENIWIIPWEMAADLLSVGWIPTPPHLLGLRGFCIFEPPYSLYINFFFRNSGNEGKIGMSAFCHSYLWILATLFQVQGLFVTALAKWVVEHCTSDTAEPIALFWALEEVCYALQRDSMVFKKLLLWYIGLNIDPFDWCQPLPIKLWLANIKFGHNPKKRDFW